MKKSQDKKKAGLTREEYIMVHKNYSLSHQSHMKFPPS
jgi:hypothetical protein